MIERITFSKINNTIWVPSSKLTNGLIVTGVWLSWLV